ncbi:MAG: sterol desaturase family protein [Cyclobacteriaceae bacterium]
MDFDPIILSIPLYFILIVIELSIQLYSKRKIYRLNDAITNISCGLTQQISNAFLKVGTLIIYQFIYENWAIFNIPITWWSVLILIFAVDFCYYWAHRMSHEVNLFWGGHVVHHQSEDYNLSVALRQSSFQVLWTFWFYIPLSFLGFDTITFLIVLGLNTVYQFWIHTETISKLPKPIEFIFNTPSHHRVHHGRNPKYIDKNHAGSLIIWDRLFGTFQEEEETPMYGVTKQLNTWNPVWANLDHYYQMFQQIGRTQGISNKLAVLINKPGWQPKAEGGPIPVPEISGEIAKYDKLPSLKLNLYILVQFSLILPLSAVFLFLRESLPLNQQLIAACMVIWSLAQFGIIFDQNSRLSWLEYIRVICVGAGVIYLFPEPYLMMIVGIVIILSIVYYYFSTAKSD